MRLLLYHRYELVECAKEQGEAGATVMAGELAVPTKCAEHMRLFEVCSVAAVESARSDTAFRHFVESGRTWKSPTKGRHSMYTI